MYSRRLRRNILLLSVTLLLTVTACQSSEAKIQKHLDTAQAKIEAGDYEVSRIELLNVLKADPSSSQAYFLLGRALAGMKDHGGAARAFASANELAPGDREIALQYTRYLMLGRAYDLAESVLRKWLADHPQDEEFLMLLSLSRAHLGDSAGSMEYAMRAVDLAPDDVDSWLNLAQVHLINQDQIGAEKALARAEKIAPDSSTASLMRVSLLNNQSRREEAVQRMETLTAANPGQVYLLIRLAGMYENLGRDEEAVRVYRQVTEQGPNALAFDRLGVLLYRADQKEEALRLWSRSVETDPYLLEARLSLAAHYLSERNLPQARKTVDEALRFTPQDAQILAMSGQIHMVMGQISEAAADLKKAVESRPDMALWRLQLAQAQLAGGETTTARENLRKLLEQQPDQMQANLLMARIEASAANFEESSGYARAASSDNVYGRAAMWILGDNALKQSLVLEAKSTNERNIYRHGSHPGTSFRLARSKELLGEMRGAEVDYRSLVKERPDYILPLAHLVSLLGRMGRQDEALVLAREKAGKGGVPQRLLLARVLEGTGNFNEAREIYLALTEDQPGLIEPYQRIVALYARESKLAEAEKWLLESIERSPTPQIRLLVLLGMVQDVLGEKEASMVTYRKILQIDPDFVPAMNNLAWNLSETGELKEALEIAARARKVAPGDPSLADTYAWILHRSGDSAGALPVLRQASEGLPDNRTVGLHLVEVLEAVGRSEEAQRRLELLDKDR